jgi:glycosyltransferase involved in cell wall biosynthesis
MINISCAIITKQEEEMLEECLASVSFCDDIVVVDSGSTDNTLNIAYKFTDRVFNHVFSGYASQKNYAIDQAKHDWILLIDADERISDALRREIELLEPQVGVVAFNLPSKTYLLGSEFNHTGFGREWHIKLFQKQFSRYSDKEIHESLIVNGQVGKLDGDVIHHTHRSIDHLLDKISRYSSFEASQLEHEVKAPVTGWLLMWKATQHFFYRYLYLRGYLDGLPGLIESVMQSYYVFINYAKLWELQQQKGKG